MSSSLLSSVSMAVVVGCDVVVVVSFISSSSSFVDFVGWCNDDGSALVVGSVIVVFELVVVAVAVAAIFVVSSSPDGS